MVCLGQRSKKEALNSEHCSFGWSVVKYRENVHFFQFADFRRKFSTPWCTSKRNCGKKEKNIPGKRRVIWLRDACLWLINTSGLSFLLGYSLKVCKQTARVPMSGYIIEKEKEEMFTRTLLCRGEKQEMFWERVKKESCFLSPTFLSRELDFRAYLQWATEKKDSGASTSS